MKLTEFIGITSRNMHVKFGAVWRSFNFWQKNADSATKFSDLTEKGKCIWNFDILDSKFSEIHETYRIYWNHLQEHVCEIWSSLEKFQFLTESCQQCRTLKRMKFWHFLKVLRNSWNLQNLLESPPGTCMWIWSSLEKFQFLTEKCRQRRTLEKGWNFDISQSSPKFMKLTEFIGITSRNMHVQFEAVWKSFNFWQKNADSAGP